ncbi:hypothetical protein PCE1_000408 [Barthelona sp. PCE]
MIPHLLGVLPDFIKSNFKVQDIEALREIQINRVKKLPKTGFKQALERIKAVEEGEKRSNKPMTFNPMICFKERNYNKNVERLNKALKEYDPMNDEQINRTNPYKTIIVKNLPKNIPEHIIDGCLRQTFTRYGPLRKVLIIHHHEKKTPKGYAFIEFEHTNDATMSLHMNNAMIFGRHIIVERDQAHNLRRNAPVNEVCASVS